MFIYISKRGVVELRLLIMKILKLFIILIAIFVISSLYIILHKQYSGVANAQTLSCDDAIFVKDNRPWTNWEEERALGPAAELDPGDPIKRIIAVPSPDQFFDIVGEDNISDSELEEIVEQFGSLAVFYSTDPNNPDNRYTRLESAISDCGPLNGVLNGNELCDKFDPNACVRVYNFNQMKDEFIDAGIDTTPDRPGDNDAPPDDSDSPEEKTCEEELQMSGAWAICLFINFIDDQANNWINKVDELLSVGGDEYNSQEMKQAWSYFRNIASLLLVVIGLVMIIGQAISKE